MGAFSCFSPHLLDFRVRLAGALREAFFLPSERDGRCEEIIRTMCAAPDSVLRFSAGTGPRILSDPQEILPLIAPEPHPFGNLKA